MDGSDPGALEARVKNVAEKRRKLAEEERRLEQEEGAAISALQDELAQLRLQTSLQKVTIHMKVLIPSCLSDVCYATSCK